MCHQGRRSSTTSVPIESTIFQPRKVVLSSDYINETDRYLLLLPLCLSFFYLCFKSSDEGIEVLFIIKKEFFIVTYLFTFSFSYFLPISFFLLPFFLPPPSFLPRPSSNAPREQERAAVRRDRRAHAAATQVRHTHTRASTRTMQTAARPRTRAQDGLPPEEAVGSEEECRRRRERREQKRKVARRGARARTLPLLVYSPPLLLSFLLLLFPFLVLFFSFFLSFFLFHPRSLLLVVLFRLLFRFLFRLLFVQTSAADLRDPTGLRREPQQRRVHAVQVPRDDRRAPTQPGGDTGVHGGAAAQGARATALRLDGHVHPLVGGDACVARRAEHVRHRASAVDAVRLLRLRGGVRVARPAVRARRRRGRPAAQGAEAAVDSSRLAFGNGGGRGGEGEKDK